MKKILVLLYRIIPSRWRFWLAGRSLLKPLRDALLRKGGRFQTTTVKVSRQYGTHQAAFHFTAALKVAAKASQKGIENALLRQSLQQLEQRLGKNERQAVVLDVGANYGYLSLVWGTFVHQGGGQVHAFEPSAEIGRCLQDSVQKSGLQKCVQVHHCGMAAQKGLIDLYVSPGAASGNPEQGFTEKVQIPALSVDEFVREQQLKRVDILKIDVDSIEYEILQGAKETLAQHRPVIFTETNGNRKILEFLKSQHYALFDLRGEALQEQQLPHDVLALPSPHHKTAFKNA